MLDTKPLTGVRILDLTRVLSGPFMTMLLSDMGAEVIKLEPLSGDDARRFAPFLGNESMYFAAVNRGKKSITLNLKTDEGKKIFFDIVKKGKIDVITENYRGGTMDKMGLGWEVLHNLNPGLIYASISGFGHTGENCKEAAYDIITQARSGMMSITGWENTPPTRVGTSIGDMSAGLFAALGVTTALYQREKTGKGQKIDISMLDCQIALLENALTRFQLDKSNPQPLGNAHPVLVPFQAFKAEDEYFVVAAANDSLWVKLCKAIDKTEWIDNERFQTVEKRLENKNELIGLLSALFIQKKASTWVQCISEAGVPCCNIASISDVLSDKQLLTRNMFPTLEGTEIKVAGNPIKMSTLSENLHLPPAPSLGENTDEIMNKILGLTKERIFELHKKGVL